MFLWSALKAELGGVLVDAYAIQTSASLYEPARGPRQNAAREFMDKYVELRSGNPNHILQECSTEDLAGMVGFYRSVVRPLCLDCAALFFRELDASLEIGSLSATERTRFLRLLPLPALLPSIWV